MNLPDGIKQAVSTAANEVFLEILGDIADDPEGGVEQYGATYQTMMAEGVMPEPQMRAMLAELAPLVTALKDALDAGFFDEEAVDLQAMIWD